MVKTFGDSAVRRPWGSVVGVALLVLLLVMAASQGSEWPQSQAAQAGTAPAPLAVAVITVTAGTVSATTEGLAALTVLVSVEGLPTGASGAVSIEGFGPFDGADPVVCTPDLLAFHTTSPLDILEVLGPGPRDAVAQVRTRAWLPPAPGRYAFRATLVADDRLSGRVPVTRVQAVSECDAAGSVVLVTRLPSAAA